MGQLEWRHDKKKISFNGFLDKRKFNFSYSGQVVFQGVRQEALA
jgi:hypothetical protein